VSAKPVDADGVTTAAAVVLVTATPLRTGRLRLLNFYGSELLPARVEYRVESWNGTNWITNTADTNCSALAAANLARPGLGAPAITYNNGVGLITFPVAGVGNYDIAANLNAAGDDTSCNAAHPVGTTAGSRPWLQFGWCAGGNKDPNARIRLGSPKAPYIYLRERY
jgi:MSHA biogenesis protein MshQ